MEFRPSDDPPAEAAPIPADVAERRCRDRCRDALLWERYLFEDHTRKEIAAWAKRLRYFRFCRAYGGHGGDGDQLVCVLRLTDEASLLATCAALGIVLQPMPGDDVKKTMTAATLPSSSTYFPRWIQPGWTAIQGVRTFVHIGVTLMKDSKGTLTGDRFPSVGLSIMDADNVWAVTDAAVAAAERVETAVQPLTAHIVDPPHDDRNCISPRWHPALFGLWHRETAEWPWQEPDPR